MSEERGVGYAGRPGAPRRDRGVIPSGELKVSVLGTLDIEGVPSRDLGSRKARALVKILAVARGRPVSVEHLVEFIWRDAPPAHPSQQLSVLVSRLRAVLGVDRLVRTDAGYHLRADWIDLDDANRLATEASRRLAAQNYASARLAAEAALTLLRGELLAGEPESPWLDEERAAVARLGVDVRRTASRAALAVGDFATARDMGETVLAGDPYDEGALQVLMAALALSGQPGTALATFARVRRRLRDDLGVSPTPATMSVHEAILQGKPIPGLAIAVTERPGRAAKPPVRKAPAAPPATKLIGRAPEVAILDAAFAAAARDGVTLCVVDGEHGIGKSSLVHGWADQTRSSGKIVLEASCGDLASTVPLHPLLAALDRFVDTEPARAVVAIGPQPRYRAIVEPPVQGRTAGVLAPALDASTRARMFDSMLAVFTRLASKGPAALVLDDIHQAGDLTRGWLTFARERREGFPLLIVVTQPAEALIDADVHINLGPLDMAAAKEILGATNGRLTELYALSRGNPLFLLHLAGMDLGPEGDAPATIRQAVDTRAAGLGPAGHTLRTAAAIGRIVDPDLLVAVLGLQPVDLFAHLESGLNAGFLEEGEGAFVFNHELVREALSVGLTGPWRAHVHRTVARLLESRQAHDTNRVAHHARSGGDVPQAVSTLQVAAAACLRRHDYAEAERLLTEAIELEDNPDTRLQRAEVRIMRADYTNAAVDARGAMVRGAGPAGLEMCAWSSYYLGEYAQALTFAEEGAQLAGAGEVRARCLVIAGRLHHSNGDLKQADSRFDEARGLAADGSLTLLAASWLAALRADQGRAAEGLDLAHIPDRAGTETVQPLAWLHGYIAYARALSMLGRLSEALEALDRLDEADHPIELIESGQNGVALRAEILATLGEHEAADRINLEAINVARANRLHSLHVVALLGLASARLSANELAETDRRLQEAERLLPIDPAFRWSHRRRTRLLRGRLALAAGQPDRALAAAHQVGTEAEKDGNAVNFVAGRMLATRALAILGKPLDVGATSLLLEEAPSVLGGEAWRLTAEIGHAASNQRWMKLADEQLAVVLSSSGAHAPALRRFADSYLERLAKSIQ